eukprot:15490-Rhodomonas_salina.1
MHTRDLLCIPGVLAALRCRTRTGKSIFSACTVPRHPPRPPQSISIHDLGGNPAQSTFEGRVDCSLLKLGPTSDVNEIRRNLHTWEGAWEEQGGTEWRERCRWVVGEQRASPTVVQGNQQ